ncbi:MAG: Gfo/Idh/MocA family oxidoreductase [Sedimentisphaerales bacterium]|nr:Gfo/Idh/MocA family oxidoreductase [Sedimentisphaerales bacterium]
MNNKTEMNRRAFLRTTGAAGLSAVLTKSIGTALAQEIAPKKMKLAIIGTGIRAIDMWGKDVLADYADNVEFVGLCDPNPGRVEFAKKYIGATCPTFTDFDKMLAETKPDKIIVTTVDAFHDRYIIKGMQAGYDIITEKPLTTDEHKCKAILDAEKKTGRNCIVTFNYRYAPHRAKLKELLDAGEIGTVTSVDFHWYLDTIHGADYFRRWHRLRKMGGTLLVHKATHHYDLLNWWLDSDPTEVFAYGALEFYGKNHEFRHTTCRGCPHKDKCKFFWDITKDEKLTHLYCDNEQYDGYHRDGCVWREDIDIFDKMAVQIKYANNVQVSYSLTTYSPYEGYRIAFNGTKGRLETWIKERQPWTEPPQDEIRLTHNFGQTQLINIPQTTIIHGGGDTWLKDKIFKDPAMADPLKQAAGTRDGAMSILVGIAARNSIDTGKPVRIADLTDIKPQPKRPV